MNKLICIIIFYFSINFSFSQIVTIPDPNFKEALLYFPVAEIGNGILEDVDTNNNGEIEVSEAEGTPGDHLHLIVKAFCNAVVFCEAPHGGDLT